MGGTRSGSEWFSDGIDECKEKSGIIENNLGLPSMQETLSLQENSIVRIDPENAISKHIQDLGTGVGNKGTILSSPFY